ncbi:response regulator [Mesorhizobium sp. CAU 1741]|uniref:response regulator n=1 Tax=Mesorhizobium sp. CAU 1741 TaxID=3140366 RepID=UPI00325B884C
MAIAPRDRIVVLIVEDEPLLRMSAVDMIEDAGFATLEAADAIEAIRLLETHPEIRIVFTDVDMPRGMNGIELARAIRDRWPPVALIVTSGKFVPTDTTLPDGAVFFSKPIREAEVVSQMRLMAG